MGVLSDETLLRTYYQAHITHLLCAVAIVCTKPEDISAFDTTEVNKVEMATLSA
jgi:hypothetical protein